MVALISLIISINCLASSDVILVLFVLKPISLVGTVNDSAILRIGASEISDKTALTEAFPSFPFFEASRIACAFVPLPDPNITIFT